LRAAVLSPPPGLSLPVRIRIHDFLLVDTVGIQVDAVTATTLPKEEEAPLVAAPPVAGEEAPAPMEAEAPMVAGAGTAPAEEAPEEAVAIIATGTAEPPAGMGPWMPLFVTHCDLCCTALGQASWIRGHRLCACCLEDQFVRGALLFPDSFKGTDLQYYSQLRDRYAMAMLVARARFPGLTDAFDKVDAMEGDHSTISNEDGDYNGEGGVDTGDRDIYMAYCNVSALWWDAVTTIEELDKDSSWEDEREPDGLACEA